MTSLFNDIENNTPYNEMAKKETPIEIRISTLRIRRLFTYLSKCNSFISLNNFIYNIQINHCYINMGTYNPRLQSYLKLLYITTFNTLYLSSLIPKNELLDLKAH